MSTTVQDRYTDTIRQTQETWAATVKSMTDNASKAFSVSDSPLVTMDPSQAIDQVFDFWTKTLDVQREAAKQLASATVEASETLRSHAESFAKIGHAGA